jgi:hypothetical protein
MAMAMGKMRGNTKAHHGQPGLRGQNLAGNVRLSKRGIKPGPRGKRRMRR